MSLSSCCFSFSCSCSFSSRQLHSFCLHIHPCVCMMCISIVCLPRWFQENTEQKNAKKCKKNAKEENPFLLSAVFFLVFNLSFFFFPFFLFSFFPFFLLFFSFFFLSSSTVHHPRGAKPSPARQATTHRTAPHRQAKPRATASRETRPQPRLHFAQVLAADVALRACAQAGQMIAHWKVGREHKTRILK